MAVSSPRVRSHPARRSGPSGGCTPCGCCFCEKHTGPLVILVALHALKTKNSPPTIKNQARKEAPDSKRTAKRGRFTRPQYRTLFQGDWREARNAASLSGLLTLGSSVLGQQAATGLTGWTKAQSWTLCSALRAQCPSRLLGRDKGLEFRVLG